MTYGNDLRLNCRRKVVGFIGPEGTAVFQSDGIGVVCKARLDTPAARTATV